MVQIPYKDDYELIVALAVGDGHLHMQNGAKNAYLDITHSASQEKYILWKRDLLQEAGVKSHIHYSEKINNGVTCHVCRLTTQSLPLITNVYFDLYRNKTKRMSFILDNLSEFVLSLWFMDDGSKKTKRKIRRADKTVTLLPSGYIDAFMIAVNGFSFTEAHCLSMELQHRYQIESTVQTDRGCPRISINKKQSKAIFRNILYPYCNKDNGMDYKISGPICVADVLKI